uniref:Ig-like domain-containing protein n=1 Tax=Neogobius melanostomus TaxID=47308 RepID=A0A8C6U7W7_9GOBI
MTTAPVFLQPIASCTVPHGEVARFHAYVSGMPKPEMTWFHNRSPVKATKNVVFHFDAVTNILSGVDPTTLSELSVTSWTENLKPSFTKKLQLQSVVEGDSVELECKIVAFPPPSILWFHNNRPIRKERRRRIIYDSKLHMHTTCLFIEPIKEKDSGSYKVMAINTEGSAESTASLLVSLREEQSANYLRSAKRSAQAHESDDAIAEQKKERKFRVDLRCVGSPFDRVSKARQGRSRSKNALVRTVYFRSVPKSPRARISETKTEAS